MSYVEMIGMLGSILVLLAMTVKSSTTKGNITMQIIKMGGFVIIVV